MNDKCKAWENVEEVLIEFSHKKRENIQAGKKSDKEES